VRRVLLPAAAGVALACLVLALLAWRSWTAPRQPAPDDPEVFSLRVEPGASLHAVSARLQARGLLSRRRLFLLMARLGGRDRELQVGRYEVPASASPRRILEILVSGRPVPVVVTLPEGLEAAQLAAILADSLDVAAAAILAAADSLVAGSADTLMGPEVRADFAAVTAAGPRPDGRPVHWCEGYLAPDTYHFAEGTGAVAAAEAAVSLQLARLDSARATALPIARELSAHELVTLASIVEAEAQRADERARIAAVYHNRLAAGMRLEADPTVAFWLGKRGERLLFRDLEVDSPYNTYRRRGLPAGPIGAPGRAAIVAAARPDTSSVDLYFVADGEGGHIFSRTHAEHERAVAEYRRLMRQRRR
jgi:UPF0755 protein